MTTNDERELDPNTIAGAARDADRFLKYARTELGAAESEFEGGNDEAANARATSAVAESNCAIVAELRALRLTIAAEGRANAARWGRS